MQKRLDMTDTNYSEQLADLAVRVQARDGVAVERLYATVTPGLRLFLMTRVPTGQLDDCVHDTFLALLRFIQSGSVKNSKCLPGIIRTIAVRIASEHRRARLSELAAIDATAMEARLADWRPDQEVGLQRRQRMELALATLASMPPRECEILRRFYLDEQSQEQICKEMGLTETQFRLLKYRAKARFGDMGRRRLRPKLERVA